MKICALLMNMLDETKYTEYAIIHQYGEDIFKYALEKRYIERVETNDTDKTYVVTSAGKEAYQKNEY